MRFHPMEKLKRQMLVNRLKKYFRSINAEAQQTQQRFLERLTAVRSVFRTSETTSTLAEVKKPPQR